MKKIFVLSSILAVSLASAQFNISIDVTPDLKDTEAILYTLNGSKDIVNSKDKIVNGVFKTKFPERYMGMMKIYLPTSNNNVSFISENKDVKIKIIGDGKGKIKDIEYLDDSNKLMNDLQDQTQKQELIVPALAQMKEYYKSSTDFGKAIDAEMLRLTKTYKIDAAAHPFITYFQSGDNQFLKKNDDKSKPTQQNYIDFIDKSNDMLETSSLLRPMLLNYLNNAGNANVPTAVDALLDRLKMETPRGQTILSELIEIFDAYGMNEFKDKYLAEAKGLKCTINERLRRTITSNNNVAMGAQFPNYQFKSPINTNAKSLYDVKADMKVIVFWSSTCSHCESELPKLLVKYTELKAKNVQIVGFSLDSNKESYEKKANVYPWINDSELKGWNSSVAETYNIHATPMYFILDANNKIINKPDHVADVLQYFNLK